MNTKHKQFENKKISLFLKKENKGFTLIETVVAIFILSLSIGALLTLSAGGFFSVRYARNQIVADNLTQEALEYIRNTRDTAFIQGASWDTWLATLNVDSSGNQVDPSSPSGCFEADGCVVDPYDNVNKIRGCRGECPVTVLYPDEGFYGYENGDYPFSGGASPIQTTYRRKITVTRPSSADHLIVTATISWENGATAKTVSQSMMVTNWNI